MAKFKLLLGAHQQAQYGWTPSEEEIEAAKLRGTTPRPPSQMFRPGDIVESDLDLVARHGAEKFMLVSGTVPKDPKRIVAKPGEEMVFPPVKERSPEGPAGQIPHQQPYPRPIVATTTADQLDESELEAVEKAEDEQKESSQRAQQQKENQTGRAGQKGNDQPDFDSMTLHDLRAYAEEEEIDLKGAKTKDDVLKTVKRGKK